MKSVKNRIFKPRWVLIEVQDNTLKVLRLNIIKAA